MNHFNGDWRGTGRVTNTSFFGEPAGNSLHCNICNPNVATPAMLNLLRSKLQLKFQERMEKLEEVCNVLQVKIPILENHIAEIPTLRREIEIEREGRLESTKEWNKLSEMWNASLAKIPGLETRTEEIAILREELQLEREGRADNEQNFLECINQLMEEIVQLKLKVIVLEERIEESQASPEITISPQGPAASPKSEAILEDLVVPSRPQENDSSKAKNFDFAEAGPTHPVSIEIADGIQEKYPPSQATSPSSQARKHEKDPKRKLCCLCGYRGPNRDALRKHLRYHSHLFSCKTCGKGFPYQYRLKTHNCGALANKNRMGCKRKITRAKKVPKTKQNIKQRDHGNKSSREVKKNNQGRNALYDNLQRTHWMGIIEEDSHGKPIRFYCKCGRGYTSKGRAFRHIQEATLGKIFKCEFCPQSYSRSEGLLGHLRARHNSRVKDYKESCTCGVCGERFENFEQIWEHHSSIHLYSEDN